MNRGRKTSPPPFFWKVPVPEKDHMTENYRRLRHIAADGQRKRGEPLKANFVPGVTKNSRYAHIPSKVGAVLKGQAQPHKSSSADELANRRLQHSQQFTQNLNGRGQPISRTGNFAQPRQSRSSLDLRTLNAREAPFNQQEGRNPGRREVSVSASGGQRPATDQSLSQPSVRILQPNPPDESIYKWRFNDDSPLLVKDQFNGNGQKAEVNQYPQQHCHRVEYLPCDGICADENIVDDKNLDSARSNSSRTSRGCNTEETRIFSESGATSNRPYRCRSLNLGENESYDVPLGNNPDARARNGSGAAAGDRNERQLFQTRKKGFFETNRTNNKQTQDEPIQVRNRSSQNYDIITNGGFEQNMRDLSMEDGIKNSNKVSNGTASKNSGAGDAFPHSLGTVPKYLKQRQQEWRVEEAAKKEAEKNAHVPPGYMIMSEEERMENLKKFKTNYDMLIAELNRIPIRIDTIRVRDHKVQLEKQLTRLEEAMKTFSRPKVWVKVDD